MKLPLLIALVGLMQLSILLFSDHSVGQEVPHRQGTAGVDSAKQSGEGDSTKGSQRAPTEVTRPSSQKNAGKNDQDAEQFKQNIETQRKLVTATIALVAVGILQALVLTWQAIALYRTLTAIKRQTEIGVRIERPWIMACIEQTMNKQVIGGREVLLNRCSIKNVGKTPAWITSWITKARDLETDILETEPNYGDTKGSIPQVLPPGDSFDSVLPWLPERLDEAHRDRLFLYIFGFVSYTDGFGDPHETRFCFRYYPPFRDNKAQGFHVAGPPACNRQT